MATALPRGSVCSWVTSAQLLNVNREVLLSTVCFQSQISVLQNRIEQLEQLLEENHQIISHIKDSVLELTDTGAVAPSGQLPFRSANGSWVLPLEGRPAFLSVMPQDCQFAQSKRKDPKLQVSCMSCFAVSVSSTRALLAL